MRLFSKNEVTEIPAENNQTFFSQVDTTERENENFKLLPDQWVSTIPLNSLSPNPEEMGLPALGANEDEIYEIAIKMSAARESFPVTNDGVYCPICHIANIRPLGEIDFCPNCARRLLNFGWD